MFLTRDMACTTAQENLMCPSYPAWWPKIPRETCPHSKKTLHWWWKRRPAFLRSTITRSTSSGNTIRKLITGRTWERMGKETLLFTKEMILKSGRCNVASGTGNAKINGRSGCGVVIKGADKDKWITISKIAVFWCTCTVMTAEVVGVCVLTGILDLVLGKNHSMKNIDQCIDAFVKSH